MQDHALDSGVFIRSMATRGHLGGLSLATREAARALDAVGFPVVLIETVGVGQVEVDIAQAADTTVVVVTPGWGDSVQANKAGLLEVADVFVVNKADRPGVADTERDLQLMLEMSAPAEWRPPIVRAVASDGQGTAEVWAAVEEHRRHLEGSGLLAPRRRRRLEDELREIVVRRIEAAAYERWGRAGLDELVGRVEARELDPYSAADLLLD
jgi:LAO/AO transport system kinase